MNGLILIKLVNTRQRKRKTPIGSPAREKGCRIASPCSSFATVLLGGYRARSPYAKANHGVVNFPTETPYESIFEFTGDFPCELL